MCERGSDKVTQILNTISAILGSFFFRWSHCHSCIDHTSCLHMFTKKNENLLYLRVKSDLNLSWNKMSTWMNILMKLSKFRTKG